MAWDYNVKTTIIFDISEMYNGDLNIVGIDEYVEKEITTWIYDSFNIEDYEQEDVAIQFSYSGKKVTVSFEFELCDDSAEEAESYVDYCIAMNPIPLGVYCSHSREAIELYPDRY